MTSTVTLPIRQPMPNQLAALQWIVTLRANGESITQGVFLTCVDAVNYALKTQRESMGVVGLGHVVYGWVDFFDRYASASDNVREALAFVARMTSPD